MAATTKPTAAKPRSAGELKRITDLIKERGIKVIDVKFTDLPGTWQHFSIPAETLDEDMVKAFKQHNIEVITLTPAEYDTWLKVARESSYAEFAKEVPDGKKLIDEALSVK